MIALRCPEPGCLVALTEVGKLTAHLVSDHLVSPSVALDRARKIQSQVPDPAGVAAPTLTRRANRPSRCKFCLRFYPEKCKHHGGPSHGHLSGRAAQPASSIRVLASRLRAIETELEVLTAERDLIAATLRDVRDALGR